MINECFVSLKNGHNFSREYSMDLRTEYSYSESNSSIGIALSSHKSLFISRMTFQLILFLLGFWLFTVGCVYAQRCHQQLVHNQSHRPLMRNLQKINYNFQCLLSQVLYER